MSCRSYSSLPTRNSQVMDSELVPFPQSCITPSFRQSRNSSLLSGTTSTSNRSLSKSMDTSLMVPSRRSLPMTLSAPWQPPHHHSVIFAALALLQQLKACSSLCYFCCSRFAPATQRALIPLLPLLLSFCFVLCCSFPSHLIFLSVQSRLRSPPPNHTKHHHLDPITSAALILLHRLRHAYHSITFATLVLLQ
jgi:hypothetical protein